MAQLEGFYDLDGKRLYSAKGYDEDNESYRYILKDIQAKNITWKKVKSSARKVQQRRNYPLAFLERGYDSRHATEAYTSVTESIGYLIVIPFILIGTHAAILYSIPGCRKRNDQINTSPYVLGRLPHNN
uniref:Uncharacterized protein n=1 Tax=Glossina palpalis gambiensis TaxID=67801 RepID=A0A1B0AW91_9MUSC